MAAKKARKKATPIKRAGSSKRASSSKPEQNTHDHWMRTSSQDGMLQVLTDLLEQMYPEAPVAIGVTLSCGGMLISGQLICAQWYFKQVEEQLTGAPAPAPAFAQIIGTFREGVRKQVATRNQGKELGAPNFVHLMNAKFHVPGQPPMLDGVLWRGRISAVDGVTIGAMSSTM